MNIRTFCGIALITVFTACSNGNNDYDASGSFEATTVVISAEANGQIKELNITEGESVKAGTIVGYIDSTQLYLKKLQLERSAQAINKSKPNEAKQLQAAQEEVQRAQREQKRVENLFKGGAATQQQFDDANTMLKIAEGKLSALQNSLQSNLGSLSEQSASAYLQIMQIDDQLEKCKIINPLTGIVLSKYAETFEMAIAGKPLYKIADLSTMFLRAYVSAGQLSEVKLGQNVKVFVDLEKGSREYSGTISWIADQAEFTPKTIQSKDERTNQVYAVKIAVKNDGFLRIGMYGQCKWTMEN